MPFSANSFESKNLGSATLESKVDNLTWADAGWTWDAETGTWQMPTRVALLESKNYNGGKTVAELLVSEVANDTFESVLLPDGTLVKNAKFTDYTGFATSLELKN